MNIEVSGPGPDYCGTCYSAAKKAGRTVSLTTVYAYPVCTLCESRLRNGLVHYSPSNGTEFDYFYSRCERCRHHVGTEIGDPKEKQCAWGILDHLLDAMWGGYDSAHTWFDPQDLDNKPCPAQCLRFTHRDDPNGEYRDPPRPDVRGQMTLGEIDIPEEPAALERAVGVGRGS